MSFSLQLVSCKKLVFLQLVSCKLQEKLPLVILLICNSTAFHVVQFNAEVLQWLPQTVSVPLKTHTIWLLTVLIFIVKQLITLDANFYIISCIWKRKYLWKKFLYFKRKHFIPKMWIKTGRNYNETSRFTCSNHNPNPNPNSNPNPNPNPNTNPNPKKNFKIWFTWLKWL